jgi:two-component system chemotaxis response regulator CheB
MISRPIDAVVVGGSAGSFESFTRLMKSTMAGDMPPIVVVFHLMRNVENRVVDLLKFKTGREEIMEAEEKEPLQRGWLYVAPPNYHLLFEDDRTFCLDNSDLVDFSRPSIDVTFESAARVYGERLAGVLLSGSNADGSYGMRCIEQKGGPVLVQDPDEAEFKTMPLSCIRTLQHPRIYTLNQIEDFLSGIRA